MNFTKPFFLLGALIVALYLLKRVTNTLVYVALAVLFFALGSNLWFSPNTVDNNGEGHRRSDSRDSGDDAGDSGGDDSGDDSGDIDGLGFV